ncbi:Acg family FMN-binding oxidoreductase [Streptomyces sp. NPDC005784]|uniref:Acg family FMN-binding oxidoreductase n=1 Tax=Streptomyces sp. NPDC005784 TaxID=3364731 RepID=UPI003674A89E
MNAEPLDMGTITALVTDAVAAPSLHNAQPWVFRCARDTGVIRLYADPERALPHTDPENRGLLMGCGAALFNLRVAAAAAGLTPRVLLLPDPASPELLAEVRLSGTGPPGDQLARLAPSIRRRHSSRFPFRDEEIPAATRDRLSEAARLEAAELFFPDPWHVRSILDLIRDAEDSEALDPAVHAETVRWTRTEPSADTTAADGIPGEAFGPRQRGRSAPVRDFAVGRPMPGRDRKAFEKNPNIALLGTARDEPVDWLCAGQALERVLLQATADGLVASITSQPLEWQDIRWAVRDPLSAMANVQMVIRLGHGPEGAASPRRPVADVLDFL